MNRLIGVQATDHFAVIYSSHITNQITANVMTLHYYIISLLRSNKKLLFSYLFFRLLWQSVYDNPTVQSPREQASIKIWRLGSTLYSFTQPKRLCQHFCTSTSMPFLHPFYLYMTTTDKNDRLGKEATESIKQGKPSKRKRCYVVSCIARGWKRCKTLRRISIVPS